MPVHVGHLTLRRDDLVIWIKLYPQSLQKKLTRCPNDYSPGFQSRKFPQNPSTTFQYIRANRPKYSRENPWFSRSRIRSVTDNIQNYNHFLSVP